MTDKNYVRVGGKVAAMWSPGLPKNAPHTSKAFNIIDPERVSSATGIYGAFSQRRDAVLADKELSPVGQKARISSLAESTFGNIAKLARDIAEMEAAHKAAVNTAVVIPKADASDTLIDLALAAKVMADDKVPTILENTASERVKHALVRIPVELSGITPETQTRIRGSLISSEKAAEFGEAAEALSAARSAVQSVINEVSSQFDATPREKAAMVGPGWKVPGFIDTAGKLSALEAA